MVKINKYRYLGRNGMITTQVRLDGVEPILMYVLTADNEKMLYNGERYTKSTEIFADDLNQWQEVPTPEWLKQIKEFE